MSEMEFRQDVSDDMEPIDSALSIDDVEIDESIPMSEEEALAYRIVKRAAMLKGVAIKRDTFLRTELAKRCSADVVDAAVATTPREAGVPVKVVDDLADAAISLETKKVTGLSALAGIPGGLAMVGTIPADIAQYFAHALRIEQKLAYLYGWESFLNEEDEVDDETMYRLILFLGVMMQVGSVGTTMTKFAIETAKVGVAKTIEKQALTKTLWYTPLKKILRVIGVKVTKSTFAEFVSKGVPIIGGAVSGGITYATFKPGANSLKRYLRTLPQATGIIMTEEEMDIALKRIEEESKNELAESIKGAARAASDKAGELAGNAVTSTSDAARAAASNMRRGFGGISSRLGQFRKGGGSSVDVAEVGPQLRALKGLLDDGVITQEDYNAKKRELLGL